MTQPLANQQCQVLVRCFGCSVRELPPHQEGLRLLSFLMLPWLPAKLAEHSMHLTLHPPDANLNLVLPRQLGCSYELSPSSGHVTAFFKPGSSSSLTASDGSTYSRTATLGPGPDAVKARLLVASDGYFSSVRRQCLNDGPPQVRTMGSVGVVAVLSAVTGPRQPSRLSVLQACCLVCQQAGLLWCPTSTSSACTHVRTLHRHIYTPKLRRQQGLHHDK